MLTFRFEDANKHVRTSRFAKELEQEAVPGKRLSLKAENTILDHLEESRTDFDAKHEACLC